MRRRRRAIGAPTVAEQAQQDAQRTFGCAACRLLGFVFCNRPEVLSPCGPTRIHHRTTGDLHGQKQLGQDATVALGDWHHQGVVFEGWTVEGMKARLGPSLYHHKREFMDLLAAKLGVRSTAALQAWVTAQLGAAA